MMPVIEWCEALKWRRRKLGLRKWVSLFGKTYGQDVDILQSWGRGLRAERFVKQSKAKVLLKKRKEMRVRVKQKRIIMRVHKRRGECSKVSEVWAVEASVKETLTVCMKSIKVSPFTLSRRLPGFTLNSISPHFQMQTLIKPCRRKGEVRQSDCSTGGAQIKIQLMKWEDGWRLENEREEGVREGIKLCICAARETKRRQDIGLLDNNGGSGCLLFLLHSNLHTTCYCHQGKVLTFQKFFGVAKTELEISLWLISCSEMLD